MQLVLDLGNTVDKVGLFDGTELSNVTTHNDLRSEELKNIISSTSPELAILASVRNTNDALLNELRSLSFHLFLDQSTPVPIENNYESKATLGIDRLAAMCGAAALHPNKNVLVIDAGNCAS